MKMICMAFLALGFLFAEEVQNALHKEGLNDSRSPNSLSSYEEVTSQLNEAVKKGDLNLLELVRNNDALWLSVTAKDLKACEYQFNWCLAIYNDYRNAVASSFLQSLFIEHPHTDLSTTHLVEILKSFISMGNITLVETLHEHHPAWKKLSQEEIVGVISSCIIGNGGSPGKVDDNFKERRLEGQKNIIDLLLSHSNCEELFPQRCASIIGHFLGYGHHFATNVLIEKLQRMISTSSWLEMDQKVLAELLLRIERSISFEIGESTLFVLQAILTHPNLSKVPLAVYDKLLGTLMSSKLLCCMTQETFNWEEHLIETERKTIDQRAHVELLMQYPQWNQLSSIDLVKIARNSCESSYLKMIATHPSWNKMSPKELALLLGEQNDEKEFYEILISHPSWLKLNQREFVVFISHRTMGLIMTEIVQHPQWKGLAKHQLLDLLRWQGLGEYHFYLQQVSSEVVDLIISHPQWRDVSLLEMKTAGLYDSVIEYIIGESLTGKSIDKEEAECNETVIFSLLNEAADLEKEDPEKAISLYEKAGELCLQEYDLGISIDHLHPGLVAGLCFEKSPTRAKIAHDIYAKMVTESMQDFELYQKLEEKPEELGELYFWNIARIRCYLEVTFASLRCEREDVFRQLIKELVQNIIDLSNKEREERQFSRNDNKQYMQIFYDYLEALIRTMGEISGYDHPEYIELVQARNEYLGQDFSIEESSEMEEYLLSLYKVDIKKKSVRDVICLLQSLSGVPKSIAFEEFDEID